ncbi:iron-containing redox enzyme family protein [Gloeocapsa sp. PCC 73106]|uniref:iron-containing redox enzyme family protein n=1 Tax=Gloeocapsa sp. PCC 73106 TaxID=102232 RepID=UPI0002AC1531|nr:iron-containing redox enzyme family protein [Gloeocapsa sp. PCC 73106]ELR97577.1 hypothetical protein GLO73106DRAFT_00013870 [Gloeocapsa sp. PCC 73106]
MKLEELENFLNEWDKTYLNSLKNIPIFNSKTTQNWTEDQQRLFIKLLYHVRSHFGEFLWHLGNFAPNVQMKEMILENIRDEWGKDGPSHEQIYLNLAHQMGVDLTYECVEQENYLPFLREYNQSQIRALIEHDWQHKLVGFAVGERLDKTDYECLRDIFRNFGLTETQLVFFNKHIASDHFEGAIAMALQEIWLSDSKLVINVFKKVGAFQTLMWQNLSQTVCALSKPQL